jgi:hydroxyacylglutathione hydrolase
MISVQAISAFQDNYIWVMMNLEARSVSVIDPGDAGPVIAFLEQHQLKLKTILITHKHQDHCGGVKALQEKYSCDVIGPKHPDVLATMQVKDGDTIFLADTNCHFKVLDIAGHTLEHIAFYCESEKILFCGDTLFSAGCGRVFEGTYDQMWQSLVKLRNLPDDTKIYCGHEYTEANLRFAKAVEPGNEDVDLYAETVRVMREHDQPTLPSLLSLEKKINPFLRIDSVGEFRKLREWKNQF